MKAKIDTPGDSSDLRSLRLVDAKELRELVPISPPTLWRWLRQGRLPKPIGRSRGRRYWRACDIAAWLRD